MNITAYQIEAKLDGRNQRLLGTSAAMMILIVAEYGEVELYSPEVSGFLR
jgi:hypothetical protein